jgi:Tfp pilus assembly protein PilF
MPSPRRIQTVCLTIGVTLGLLGGCASTGKDKQDKKDQPSGTILSSGPQPKVTSQQSADVQIAMGQTLEEEGKTEEAKAAYLSAFKQDSRRADAALRLAILEERKANVKDADRYFAQALKLEPRSPEIHCDRGYCLYQRKQLDDAEKSLKAALAIDPLHQRSHNNLALVLVRKGDNEGALREFAKAGCDHSDALSNLGLALAMDGKFDESKKQYVQALKAKPTSTAASRGLQATIVALAGQGDPTAIATRVVKPPATPAGPTDPAIMRTSVQR